MEAPWPVWAALLAFMTILWTIPIWRQEKATPLTSPDDLGVRISRGQPSLLHFYSNF